MTLAIQIRIPRTIPVSLCLDESNRLAISGQWIREKESIIYLGDGKGSNKWNVITNHSFDTVETVSNKSKSTSLIQKKDTWESNTTNNGAEWNCGNDTFLKIIRQIIVSDTLVSERPWQPGRYFTWLICEWNPAGASIWCFIQNILSFGISALFE